MDGLVDGCTRVWYTKFYLNLCFSFCFVNDMKFREFFNYSLSSRLKFKALLSTFLFNDHSIVPFIFFKLGNGFFKLTNFQIFFCVCWTDSLHFRVTFQVISYYSPLFAICTLNNVSGKCFSFIRCTSHQTLA